MILFLLPVLLVWGGIEIFYRTTTTNYTYKRDGLNHGFNDLEILILGNSQSLFGINPLYFKRKTFNSANISQSLYFDELILDRYIEDLPELKAVLINISYFSLSQQDDSSEDRWRKYFYEQQMDLDVPIVSDYDIKKYSLALSRRFRKSVELIEEYIKKGTIVNCDRNGYGIQDESNIVEDKEEISKLIARKHENGSMNFEVNHRRLERIAELCGEKNVQVFLVQLPVYKTYYTLLDKTKLKKIDFTCENLAETHRNVHHINLLQNKLFKPDDLRDADHLTNEGAKKCSIMLNSIIESKLKRN